MLLVLVALAAGLQTLVVEIEPVELAVELLKPPGGSVTQAVVAMRVLKLRLVKLPGLVALVVSAEKAASVEQAALVEPDVVVEQVAKAWLPEQVVVDWKPGCLKAHSAKNQMNLNSPA
ncbi:MAG: hypothetical protein PWR01_2215 [Clostridiales bacterium]|nr:hypothetical protein [Clostridiales bacterium]MDN5281142.1 hypothetical protein [Candidatus Ozemobacter sp.]